MFLGTKGAGDSWGVHALVNVILPTINSVLAYVHTSMYLEKGI